MAGEKRLYPQRRGGRRARGRSDEGWDAERIRLLRRHLQLTQRELARELNARQQTVSEWETGQYRPRGPSARLLTLIAEDARFPYAAELDAPERSGEADRGEGRRPSRPPRHPG